MLNYVSVGYVIIVLNLAVDYINYSEHLTLLSTILTGLSHWKYWNLNHFTPIGSAQGPILPKVTGTKGAVELLGDTETLMRIGCDFYEGDTIFSIAESSFIFKNWMLKNGLMIEIIMDIDSDTQHMAYWYRCIALLSYYNRPIYTFSGEIFFLPISCLISIRFSCQMATIRLYAR